MKFSNLKLVTFFTALFFVAFDCFSEIIEDETAVAFAGFIQAKRELAFAYKAFVASSDWRFVDEPEGSRSNFWLNAVLCHNRAQRDALLNHLHSHGILSRPIWTPMHLLPMFATCLHGALPQTERLFDTLVNLPSSVPAARSA